MNIGPSHQLTTNIIEGSDLFGFKWFMIGLEGVKVFHHGDPLLRAACYMQQKLLDDMERVCGLQDDFIHRNISPRPLTESTRDQMLRILQGKS